MSLIEGSALSKRFGDTTVLHDVALILNAGEHVGLVGPNGVGKSTLVKMIVGELEADSGSLRLQSGLRLGYLAQATAAQPGQTVQGLVEAALGDIGAIEARLRTLEHAMAAADGESLAPLLEEYAAQSTLFEQRGGYAGYAADEVMAGLGLAALDRRREVASLSGGEKARLGLAALLLQAPDLLLLDEPTNHLDFAALAWLEQALTEWRGALLVVSHDRVFLDRTVQRILEVDDETRGLRSYPGNFTAWAQEKQRERAQRLLEYETQQEEIRALRAFIKRGGRVIAHNRKPTDSDGFYMNFKGGRIDTAKSRDLRSAEERLRRLETEAIQRPPPPVVINSTLTPATLGSRSPIATANLAARYGARTLFADVSLTLQSRARVVIIGPNGAGKSTLLRLLAGEATARSDAEPPPADVDVAAPLEVEGLVRRAPGVVVGYLDQEQETLDAAGSVYEGYAAGQVGDWEQIKTALITSGLFTWPELARPVAVLSTGQKRKLQIARLIAANPNVLLLDEPTNHLSLDVLEQVEEALLAFEGPMLAISHDRRFLERFGDELWEIADGRLRRWAGGWAQFQAATT